MGVESYQKTETRRFFLKGTVVSGRLVALQRASKNALLANLTLNRGRDRAEPPAPFIYGFGSSQFPDYLTSQVFREVSPESGVIKYSTDGTNRGGFGG